VTIDTTPDTSTSDGAPDSNLDVAPEIRSFDAKTMLPGLVAEYDFENPSNLGMDSVGSLDATEVYNASQVPGHIGSAVLFQAGYMALPLVTDFELVTGGDFSLEIWINTNSHSVGISNLNFLTSSTSTIHAWGLAEYPPDNVVSFVVNGDESAMGTTDVYDGVWHHVVGTRSGLTLKIYVDGKLEGTHVARQVLDRGGTLAIGRDGACCGNFIGKMDRIRIWQKALTDAEVLAASKE
jgi:hypothetical protein